jgi:hypothetical protein
VTCSRSPADAIIVHTKRETTVRSKEAESESYFWTAQRLLRPLDDAPPGRPRGPQLEVWAKALQRSPDCLVDASGLVPGPYLRWLCLLRLICERWPGPGTHEHPWRSSNQEPAPRLPTKAELADALWRAYRRANPDERMSRPPAELLRKAFYYGVEANVWNADAYSSRESELHRALEQAWREIREIDGLQPRSLAELALADVKGAGGLAESLERLGRWIETDEHGYCDDLSRLQAEYLAMDKAAERDARVDAVVDSLLDESTTASPLTNVYADDTATGLRAFATEVCCRVKAKVSDRVLRRRPALLYLSLNRLQAGVVGRRPTRRYVVEILCRWLGLPEPAGDPGDDPGVRELEPLQEALTTRRLIIVLDGVEVASRPFGAMWEAIRNRDWVPFLRTLMQAPSSALEASHGAYRSRVLALSNQPLDDLRAWMDKGPMALPWLDDPHAVSGLFIDASAAQHAAGLLERCERLWRGEGMRPCASSESLSAVFGLKRETTLELVTAARGMPGELDLALARCAQDVDRRLDFEREDWRRGLVGRWLSNRPARRERPQDDPACVTLVLQLLAVSVSGLRVGTLWRAVRRLALRTPAAADMPPLGDLLRHLRSKGWARDLERDHCYLIELSLDGDRLHIPKALREFELGLEGAVDAGAPDGAGDHLLDLRSERMREAMLGDMLSTPAGVKRFELLNEVLAEEALAQATGQARHVEQGVGFDPMSVRRYVQTIFHGLMSLDMNELGEHDPRPSAQPLSTSGHALPRGSYRRFVYLYEFVYRRCLEDAPARILGRGYGLEDLRLALLAMFANPGWARRVLSLLHQRPLDQRSFETFGAFADQPVDGFGRALQPGALHLHGALGADLFNALLHACLRSGRQPRYAQRADVIAGQLTLSRPMRRQSDDVAVQRRSFVKIAIDALQAANELDQVDAQCRAELTLLEVRVPFDHLRGLGGQLRERHWHKGSFESETLRPLVEALCRPEQRHLTHVSDVLFRVGERLATDADWNHDPADLDGSRQRYADAYAVFWIGDRVRAAAATLDDAVIDWPAVSARAVRYFIRVSLKLAKLTVMDARQPDHTAASAAVEHAMAFYGHARARIDVYSRHLARYPAERAHGLLLLAAAARVRASMAASLVGPRGDADESDQLLGTSSHYLQEAWPLMVKLQFYRAIHKRFLLERIKTHRKIAECAGSTGGHAAGMAARDLQTLEKLSVNSPYWRRLLAGLGRGH